MNRLVSTDDGSVLVEVALALPVLALLLAGTINYGVYMQRKMQLAAAASAGAAFASIPGNQNNTAGMQNTAKSAAPALSGLTVTATIVYTCTYGGTMTTVVPACSNGASAYQYVRVQASTTVPAMIGVAWLPASITVNAQVLQRVLY